MNRGLMGFLRNKIKKHKFMKALIENDELVIKEMGSDLVIDTKGVDTTKLKEFVKENILAIIDTEYLVLNFVTTERIRIYTWHKGNKLYFYEERPRVIHVHIIDMLKEVHKERVVGIAR